METEYPPKNNTIRSLKTWANISLIVSLLYVIRPLISVYQTKYQLTSPFIPEQTIWEIVRQNIFEALFGALVCLVALVFYFLEKYLGTILLVALALIAGRYIVV